MLNLHFLQKKYLEKGRMESGTFPVAGDRKADAGKMCYI
jgi:hypothetical protein